MKFHHCWCPWTISFRSPFGKSSIVLPWKQSFGHSCWWAIY